MRRLIGTTILIFMLIGYCRAEFSATGGVNGTPYAVMPSSSTGIDRIFVFDGMQNASLSFSVSDPGNWKWYSFKQDISSAVEVPTSMVQVGQAYTSVNNLQADQCYFVVSGEGVKKYAYVIDYKPVSYNEIRFIKEGDECTDVTLKVDASMEDMYYYTISGLRKVLEREHNLTWNTLDWNSSDQKYVTKQVSAVNTLLNYNWSVAAPLVDTYFTISGDQYAKSFGIAKDFQSSLYKAVAVKTNANAAIQARTAENESGKITEGTDLAGSAPLVVQFHSNPSDAVNLVEWYIYKPGDASGSYNRFTDEDLLHSFTESGQYTVKEYVSNSSCKDSAVFNPKVSESMLDCPNFFTPRSTPGENDEFRVVYRSIVSFKGVIVNRWGNVIFKWSDPAVGWNGTYNGKPVSPGVYFYVIEAKGSDGIVYKKRGDINLLE